MKLAWHKGTGKQQIPSGCQRKQSGGTPNPFDTFYRLTAIGFVAILLFCIQFIEEDWAESFSVLSVAVLVAGASAALGGILGLLFGIPRMAASGVVRSQITDRDAMRRNAGMAMTSQRIDQAANARVLDNTNLEEVSDWLTKILLGAGLTQLSRVPEILSGLGDFLFPGLGSIDSSKAFGTALVVYFLAIGFAFAYQWTRLYFRWYLERFNRSRSDDVLEAFQLEDDV